MPASSNVMAGGNALRAEQLGVIEEGFELDFPVTHDIRIWGAASAVLLQEMLKYVIPVFTRKIDRV